MLPLIIMAAASILSNKQKQQKERQNIYLDQLEKNAQRAGGNTDMASIIRGEHQIDEQGADYSGLLGLVGKGIGGGSGASDVAADDGTGDPGILSHAKPWEDDLDSALGSFDRYRGFR